ncbi:chromosome segregation protein [Vibrio ruber DSM 16370]|uniref:Chromosome segregation protein n=1 Tax=Vibrio ruber (strain DSM 16370 / JCM 11486 / BCRC 17186 / CECT 7878 / LMG 23124 / VR1) TaxID=1123498 RepID=A0A1R4LP10_VIBR1|nr:DNA sulfur modification protein DndD [Vibrio ruber]SJN58067.1 chromosome segregation protein [Vibrio ruber DSM 16370]
MIFEQVKLNNFGIYQGEHTIDLNSSDASKPIILFGGLNGGGKTTFLDSMQLALYGKHAKCSNRGRLPYSDYLKRSINRFSGEKSASVSLTFRHSQGTKDNQYQVVRSWTDNGNAEISDTVQVFINGEQDRLLTDNWNDFVSEFIPQNMSELFFFDGEKIEDLADESRSAQLIKTGIEALLGLELLSQLSKDLNSQRQRRQEKNLDKKASERVQELLDRKQSLENNLQELEQEIKATIARRETLEEELKSAEVQMHSTGAHLLESLAEIQAERREATLQLDAIDSHLGKLASGALPLRLGSKLFKAAHQQSQKEQQASEISNAQKHITAQNTALMARLTQSANAETVNLVQQLLEQIHQETDNNASGAEIYLHTNPTLFEFAQSLLANEAEESQTLLKQKNELVEKLALIDKKLEAVPDYESVKDLIAAKENVEARIEQSKLHLEATLEERNQCQNQLHENESRLDATLVQQNAETFEHQRNQQVADHLVEMKSIIDDFKEMLIRENISKLEDKIKRKFDSLGRKSELISKVHINTQNFKLQILGNNNQPIDSARLSAGERQLLSVATLWALADESGKEIPTIIDTPMGRLDGKHRTKLVENYFPQAAEQVILLSTDEEISGEYYKKLKPYIASEYHIAYDESQKTSTIRPGYFAEEV